MNGFLPGLLKKHFGYDTFHSLPREIRGYTDEALKPDFDHLKGLISYGKLRIHRAFQARQGM